MGRASVGDIMAFQWYTFLLLNPVWNIVNSFSELQRSLAAMERVFEVLAMEDDKPDRPTRATRRVVHEIRFEDVEFEYREGRPVVRDFNVMVPGGSVVALVGRSGAGKTTVTDLVARFHDPTRGRILLNGTDIRDFQLRTYRDLLAIVQQDVFLFDGSVRDNIAYGRHDATDAEVEDAARRANAHEFIVRLPEGYETFVGERGVKLSGGQQQRLAIARAILASPQILILDEATSNLDTESEQLIQASMATLLAGRTTFVIAHRLSTIRRADLILLMEDGRIIERGGGRGEGGGSRGAEEGATGTGGRGGRGSGRRRGGRADGQDPHREEWRGVRDGWSRGGPNPGARGPHRGGGGAGRAPRTRPPPPPAFDPPIGRSSDSPLFMSAHRSPTASIRSGIVRIVNDCGADLAALDLLPGARRGHGCAPLGAHRVGRRERRAVAVAPGVDEDPAAAVHLVELLREVLRIANHEQRSDRMGESGDVAGVGVAVERHDDVEALGAGRLDPARQAQLVEQIAELERRVRSMSGASIDGSRSKTQMSG